MRRWWVLGMLSLSVLMIAMDATILTVALPLLAKALRPDAVQTLWIVDVYSLVIAGLLITAGTLGDRVGRKRFLLAGYLVFGVASAVVAFAPDAGTLIAARALLGVGGALIMPATLSTIRAVFTDRRQRAFAIAVWSAVASAGAAVGPVVGGLLLDHFWWGSGFLINVPVVLVALVACAVLVPETRNPEAGRWDWPGAVLSMAGMVALLYGVKKVAADAGGGGPVPIVVGLAGLVLLGLFVRRQRRIPQPLVDLRLFGIRPFAVATVSVLLTLLSLFALLLFLPQYLAAVRGMSELAIGLTLVPLTAAMTVGALAAAPLVSGRGPSLPVAGGLGLVAVGCAAVGVTLTWGPVWIAAASLPVGLGAGVGLTAASDTIMNAAPERQAGAAAAIDETCYELGGALGIAVLGSLLAGIYRAGLGRVSGVPEHALRPARESVTGAMTAADGLASGPAGLLRDAARVAFEHAFRVTSVVSVVLVAGTAVVAGVLLAGHGPVHAPDTGNTVDRKPGQQVR